MKRITGADLCRLLERRGWRLMRTQGSHRIYGKEGSIIRLSVPVHAGRDLKTGLVRHILRLAGIDDADL